MIQHKEDEEKWIKILNELSYRLKWSVAKKEYLEVNQQILNILQKNHDDNSEEVINAMKEVASAFNKLKNYEKEKEIREKIIERLKTKYDDTSEEVIKEMDDLAQTLSHMKDVEGEVKIREELVEIYKNKRGDDHEDTINAMNKVSDLLWKLNRHDEAVKIQMDIAELMQQKYGEHSGELIDELEVLADNLYRYSENYAEELKIRLRIVKIFEDSGKEKVRAHHDIRRYGYEHDIYYALYKLANVYDNLGQSDGALKVRERIIEEHQKKLNELIEKFGTEEHDDVLWEMDNIARDFRNINRLEKELEWRKRIVDILKSWKGEDDEETIDAMDTLAEAQGTLKLLNKVNEPTDDDKYKNIE